MSENKKPNILISVTGSLFRVILAVLSIFAWKKIFEIFEGELSSLLGKYLPQLTMNTLKTALIISIALLMIFFLKDQIERIIGHSLFQKKEAGDTASNR